MNIAVIGTGNVGGALATGWSSRHQIRLGVRDLNSFKGVHLLDNPNTTVHLIQEAVSFSDVILLAVPAIKAIETTISLGDTGGKVIIDAMNVVMGNGPEGYSNTADAILAHTATNDVVKCFNTTGYNNMLDPKYGDHKIDMYTCGDSEKGKSMAEQLADDIGFAECYDIGGNDKFDLIEQFAFFWINLAMKQGLGREIGFKLMKR